MQPENKIPALIWGAACVLPALLLYLATMSSAITLVDAGLFHMVCADNGIAHPPGYPLATALCHPFMSLPFEGTIPGNLFSIFFAGIAIAILFLLLTRLGFSRSQSCFASFLFAISWGFWSQAIVLEIYTLNAALVALLLTTCVQYERTHRPGWLIAAGLVFGLGLANHWPLIVLSAIATAPILLQDMRALKDLFRPGVFITTLAAICLGLSPYLLMLNKSDAYMTMIGPVGSFSDLLLYISRSTYQDNALISGSRSFDYLWWLPLASFNQWGPIGWVLIPIGLARSFFDLTRPHASALVLLWLANCTLLPLFSNYSFAETLRYYYLTWSIPAHISSAIWLLLGARFLLNASALQPAYRTSMLGLICVTLAAYNFTRTNPNDAIWVEQYNRLLLQALPLSAVLFVEGDAETGPVGYLHHVQGVRKDIELRNRHNILFGNRLADPRGYTIEQEQAIQQYVLSSGKRAFFISPPALAPTRDHGLFFEVGRSGFAIHEALDNYMARLIPFLEQKAVRDPFIYYYLNEIVYHYARAIVGIAMSSEGVDPAIAPQLALVSTTLQGKTWTLHHLLGADRTDIDMPGLFSLIQSGEQQITRGTVASGAGNFLRLAGDAWAIYGEDSDAALARYRRAQTFDASNETCRYLADKKRLKYHSALSCEKPGADAD